MAGVQQVSFTSPYTAEEEEIDRRRKMAELLQAQAAQPLDATRQAGGWAIPISPWEGAAKMVQGAAAGMQNAQAMALRRSLEERQRGDLQGDMRLMVEALRGKPAQAPDDEERMLGVGPGSPGAPAVPHGQLDPSILSQLRTPMMMQAAVARMMPKEPIKLGQGDVLYDQTSGKPLFQAPQLPKFHAVGPGQALVPEPQAQVPQAGGVPVPQAPVQPVYTAPEKVPEAMQSLQLALKAAGVQPGTPQYQSAMQAFVQKATTHQPAASMNVGVNTEKSYFGNVAEGLAKNDVAAIDAGRAAPQRIEGARRVKELLSTVPITGTAAEWRLTANKALATAGIIDGDRVKNTENLAAELASATLDAIKTSGLGSGQGFTDKDRQFLERARAGNIEVNPDTLRYLADLNERSGMESIKKANTVMRRLRVAPQMGGAASQFEDIPVPGEVKSNLSPATLEFLKARGIKP